MGHFKPRIPHIMETSDSFDLNRAISTWREAFSRTTPMGSEDLRELECHLRDLVGELRTSGLSEEEAFLISSRRLGRPESLADEFEAATNREAIWAGDFIWLLSGIFCFEISTQLIRIFSIAMQLAVKDPLDVHGSPQMHSFRLVVLIGTAWTILPTALWITWRFSSRMRTNLRDLLNKARQHIAGGAVLILGLPLILQACESFLSRKLYAPTVFVRISHVPWLSTISAINLAAALVIPVAILLLLRRNESPVEKLENA
jgi:hypothetical protein